MNTLMLLKHLKKKIITQQYFKDEDEAMHWWCHFPAWEEWEVISLEERTPRGHRYELMYAKFNEQSNLHPKYIICFSKKEALSLENKIKEANLNYITQIKKLY